MTATALRTVHNMIGGEERPAASGETFEKLAPATGEPLSLVARSDARDVDAAVDRGRGGAAGRGRRGRSRSAAGSCAGSRSCSSATGTRSRGSSPTRPASRRRTRAARPAARSSSATSSPARGGASTAGRSRARRRTARAMTIRQPLGVAGLIIAANTPIANVAWKVFPALLCGNAAVLKASEDTPETATCLRAAGGGGGAPGGVLNVVQGYGEEAGQPLVEDPRVAVLSFTGSTAVGRMIAEVGGRRLAKVCLELGGKNPLVVCDDADLEAAAETAALSAFSNAGQRCAAGSRLIVFDAVYDRFRELLVERANAQRVGSDRRRRLRPGDQRAPAREHAGRGRAGEGGGRDGRHRRRAARPARASTSAPTIVEGAPADSEIACTELFGPITTLHRVAGFEEALAARERELVRPDRGDLDALDPPRPGVRPPRRRRRRPGERPDLRLRAARPLRRPARLRAPAGASRGRRRSTSTPTGRWSTSRTTRRRSSADAAPARAGDRPGGHPHGDDGGGAGAARRARPAPYGARDRQLPGRLDRRARVGRAQGARGRSARARAEASPAARRRSCR